MSRWLEVLIDVPVYTTFTYRHPDPDAVTPLTGFRAEVPFGSRYLTGYIINSRDTLPSSCPVSEKEIKPVKRIIDREALFDEKHIQLAKWMAGFYLCGEGEALAAMLPSGRRESAVPGTDIGDVEFSAKPFTLSDEQIDAVTGIRESGGEKPVYLWGLTGSGKTEVFLQAAEEVMAQGKSVIYLVPEIALTHQVEEAVTARFGQRAAVLHSGLTGSRRLSEWMRIKRGDARIVVGARSAVFAPVCNLGLIIIDEEHDGSYKSGATPRYHARQIAMRRCTDAHCPLVMGSATPSVEAWHQMETGSIERFTLTARLSGGAPPEITIVPLGGETGALSSRLIQEIRDAKEAGRQSIIFLNRRGFTHFFRCNTCGYEMKCRNCSVPATWHRKSGVMKCHYCGWQSPPPSVCPECGSLDTGYAGFGTEFIEDELRSRFPGYTIQRIDTDTLTVRGERKKVLDDFRNGKIDILLGTQMVAKGLNFPGVRLVGIALADTGLHMPDFRAAERTFALITQVAGRAGRFFPDGRVLIQTWSPNNPAIRLASQGNIRAFYEWETGQRRMLDFPPFCRMVRLVFRSKKAETALAGAAGAAQILAGELGKDGVLLGPAECPISLISGNHRHHVILKGPQLAPLLRAARHFQTNYKPLPSLHIEYDVDPVNVL